VSVAARWAAPLLFVLLLLAFAAGIWGMYRAAFPGKGLYRMTAVVERRASDTLLLVKHEAVAGLMGEMSSMALVAESPALLDAAALAPGERVQLTVRQASPDPLVLVEVQKIR
jgi:hypothetical protein